MLCTGRTCRLQELDLRTNNLQPLPVPTRPCRLETLWMCLGAATRSHAAVAHMHLLEQLHLRARRTEKPPVAAEDTIALMQALAGMPRAVQVLQD